MCSKINVFFFSFYVTYFILTNKTIVISCRSCTFARKKITLHKSEMFIKLLRTNFIGRRKYFTALIDLLAVNYSKKLAPCPISNYLLFKITFILTPLINLNIYASSLEALNTLYLLVNYQVIVHILYICLFRKLAKVKRHKLHIPSSQYSVISLTQNIYYCMLDQLL